MSKVVPRTISSLIDTSHPVINTLGHTFGGYLPGKRSVVKGVKTKGSNASKRSPDSNTRVDIVDEKLCGEFTCPASILIHKLRSS